MKLWYIAIGLDRASFGTEYCYEFDLRTRFISNYLSKQIRKVRFETDGTFNMIFVNVTPRIPKKCAIVPIDVLEAEVAFDQDSYEQLKTTRDYEYYLTKYEQGFRNASECKDLPLSHLLDLIKEFKNNGCKNEWTHKKRRFTEFDIEVTLNCFFTSLDFQLVATVRRISTKEELCSGILLQTDPDELCFDKEFKDILIDERNIIITDFLDKPRFLIDLKKAMSNQLTFEHLPDEEDDDD